MTLVEFLLARITEDEAVATESFYDGQRWYSEEEAVSDFGRYEADDDRVIDADRKSDARHIARWEPARVLAECAAKRAIIEIHRFDEGGSDPCDAHDPDFRSVDCDTLLLLAAPYASHEHFEPVWGTP